MPECEDCGQNTTGVEDYDGTLCRICRDKREGILAGDGGRPEPEKSEPADFGGGESTGVQDL